LSTTTHTSLDDDQFESQRGFSRAMRDGVRDFLRAAFGAGPCAEPADLATSRGSGAAATIQGCANPLSASCETC